jgi:hypothetical protein
MKDILHHLCYKPGGLDCQDLVSRSRFLIETNWDPQADLYDIFFLLLRKMNVDKEGPTLKITVERRLRKVRSDIQFWLKKVFKRIDPKRPLPFLPIDAHFDWCIRCWRPGQWLYREADRQTDPTQPHLTLPYLTFPNPNLRNLRLPNLTLNYLLLPNLT